MCKKFILVLLSAVVMLSCSKHSSTDTPGPKVNQTLMLQLKNNYDFSEFYNAVLRVHLDTLLEKDGPYTILLPDNVALQAQGITQDSLNRMDTGQLRQLLAYHILSGNITYASVPQALDYVYTNIEGLPLYFSEPIPGANQVQGLVTGITYLHVNGVKVTTADVLASNGTIQVLASTLRYPSATIKSFLENTAQYSDFTEALRHFNLLDRLDSPGRSVVLAPNNTAMERYQLTADSIDRIDTANYYNYFFGACIIPNDFFFESDMADGPQEGAYANISYYVTPDYVLVFSGGANIVVYPSNYALQSQAEQYSSPWGLTAISDPDHLAGNGIVQGVSSLLIYPDSALKH